MTARSVVELVLVALVSLGAIGWCAERDASLRAEGREQVLAVRVDSLERRVLADSLANDSLRVVAELEAQRADSVVAEKEAEVEQLRGRRPRVVERIVREAGPDSTVVREAIAEVERTIWVPQVSALELALVAEKEARRAVESERDGLRTELQSQRALRQSIEAMHSEHMRSHTFLDTNLGKLLLVGGSLYVGSRITP